MKRPTIGFTGAFVATCLLVAACYTGPGPDHFATVIDDLVLPAGWELAHSTVRGPQEAGDQKCDPIVAPSSCPMASRYYLVDAQRDQVYEQARMTVSGAGFSVTRELSDDCKSVSDDLPCVFYSQRGEDQIDVLVYPPGVNEQEGVDVARADRALVVLRSVRLHS